MQHQFSWLLLLSLIITCGCNTEPPNQNPTLFEQKDPSATGIDFTNTLKYDRAFNVYTYRNFYNGGGVSIGDINNDGKPDIYLVANQGPNQLYLNKGNWKFENITQKAGVAGQKAWSTGVTMVDINADGLLDIYVCNSGDVQGDNKENELFINQGDLTFKESAQSYGLNDKGYSTHASFFDYDKDGDLDVYLLNNSFQAIGSFNLKKNERPVRDELGGDKLLRNDGGTFVDVSEEAGIYGSVIGFGLGITIGDVNQDGWEDIFISNDFFERDYLYINQQDGTFKEDLVEQMPSISGASMGADIADINNDGYNEIFVTEMLPFEYERLKTVTTFEDWDRYQYNVENGYHHQFTRNTLHLNNKNNTFSEIGRLAGVEASDWSWGALFFDMDNDGKRDLFIANGIFRDLTNQDYLQYIANESVMKSIITEDSVNYKELIDIIPSNPVRNQAYKNIGSNRFEIDQSTGLWDASFSNGSAYGDLDMDGDLDLVVNNVNMPAFIYENKANEQTNNHFISLKLIGKNQNTLAIGSKIKVETDSIAIYAENQPTRGFESSMDPTMVLGVGNAQEVDITIQWPTGGDTVLNDVAVNQLLTISESRINNSTNKIEQTAHQTQPKWINHQAIDHSHKENRFNDFNNERLMYHMVSTSGPRLAIGDLDSNGDKEIIFPGARGQFSTILGKVQNVFQSTSENPFNQNKQIEFIEAESFDVDGDGDLDVYLASGGVEVNPLSPLLDDCLYFNDGNGNFTKSPQSLPSNDQKISTGAVASGDFDQDGDLDLLIGERIKIGAYGASCSAFLLQNNGQGVFEDVTEDYASELTGVGMITDLAFNDLDGDGWLDIILVGEYMDVTIFKNFEGEFKLIETPLDLKGWWNKLAFADLDQDGDQDLILGNHGLNSRFRANHDHPIKLYFSDFDQNGYPEGITTMQKEDGKDYPYALRHNLMMRLPKLKKKYPDFESFKNESISEIFSAEELKDAIIHEAHFMETCILINEGDMQFTIRSLPQSVQYAPIYAIEAVDVDNDLDVDLLMGGNLHHVQPEMGRYDASYGHVLINDGNGNFTDQSLEYGVSIKGEVRDIIAHDGLFHFILNNDYPVTYYPNPKTKTQ